MNFSEKLNKCCEEYPFNFWLQSYEEGIGYFEPLDWLCVDERQYSARLISSFVHALDNC